jgi:hypothetical protein
MVKFLPDLSERLRFLVAQAAARFAIKGTFALPLETGTSARSAGPLDG